MFYTLFTKLCEEKKVPPTKAAVEMGFSNSTASKWAKGSEPSGPALQKIAKYFGVTVDYLLGKEPIDPDWNKYTDEDLAFLDAYKNADEATKELVRRAIEAAQKRA